MDRENYWLNQHLPNLSKYYTDSLAGFRDYYYSDSGIPNGPNFECFLVFLKLLNHLGIADAVDYFSTLDIPTLRDGMPGCQN